MALVCVKHVHEQFDASGWCLCSGGFVWRRLHDGTWDPGVRLMCRLARVLCS